MKWTQQVQDRLQWKDIVEKARIYRSCSAIEKKKAVAKAIVSVTDEWLLSSRWVILVGEDKSIWKKPDQWVLWPPKTPRGLAWD